MTNEEQRTKNVELIQLRIMKKISTILLLSLYFLSPNFGQEDIWDLTRCLQYAEENNLQIKQAVIGVRQAELNEEQARKSRLPNLTGSASHTYNFGRSIDPTTNSFESQTIQSNSFGLSGGGFIYNGAQIRNSIKQSKYDVAATQADAARIKNDLGLSIAQAYLQVLLAQDQINITQNRLKQTQAQLDRTQKLVNAGAVARVTLLDLEAQIAADDQSIVASENALIQAFAFLKTQLNLDPDYRMKIQRPSFELTDEVDISTVTVETLYNEAIKNQPQIVAGEYRKKSAEIGVNIAKAGLRPSLTYFGGLNSRYSNLGRRSTGETNTVRQSFGDVDIPGIGAIPIEFDAQIPILENNPFMNQLNENFSQSIGLNLNVPIYSRGQNRIAIERAELGILSADLSNEQARQQLKADIQNALIDARAALKTLSATEKTLEAREVAFTSAKKRFDLGAINTFDYTAAKDALDIAKVNMLNAKYQYVFNLKVLDYYLGKEITL